MHIPKINWKVRMKSKKFWIAMIPAVLYLAGMVSSWFGYEVQIEFIQGEAMKFVEATFAILMLMGIIVDPTTEGLNDSERAMKY